MAKYASESFKWCTKCNLCLPSSEKFFRRIKKGSTFHSWCRLCTNDRRGNVQLVPPQVIPHSIASKPGKAWQATHVFLGDLHMPFHSKWALKKAIEYIGDKKPEYVWQLADLNDQFAFSKYPRSHNVMTPRQEINEARFYSQQMWADIQRVSPYSKCRQLAGGNHDERLKKRIYECAPEAEDFVEEGLDKLYSFQNVLTYKDSKQEIFEDGMCIMHGYKKFGDHARFNQMNTVTGHTHHGGVLFFQNAMGTYWELNAGCLIDRDAPVFNYKNQNRIDGITIGIGEVDQKGPRFIPFYG